jgi:uncharacterized membrane protein
MCAIFCELLWNSHFTTRKTIALHPMPHCAASNTTMTVVYDIATAAVAGMMVGNEFAVAAFVHPQLRRLDDRAHAQTAALLAGSLGKAMPLWYGLALLLILGAAFEHRPISSGPGLFLASAAVLWVAIILFTVTMLVPINNRIAGMNPKQPHEGWLRDRARWDQLHRIRVALLIVALLLLLAGLIGGAAIPAS